MLEREREEPSERMSEWKIEVRANERVAGRPNNSSTQRRGKEREKEMKCTGGHVLVSSVHMRVTC